MRVGWSDALRPVQDRAVGLRRVGGGEHDRGRGVVVALRAQALDRARQRELRAAEALDEVAAPGDADRLQRRELVVQRGEAAGDALGQHLLAGDDAVALEQQLGLRAAARGRVLGHREQRRDERPAALDLRLRARPPRREPAPAVGPRGLRPRRAQPRRAQRRVGVVGDLARPHEVPQRLLELLARDAADVGQQVGEEARAGGEPLADRVVGLALGRLLRRRRPEQPHVLAEVERHPAGAAAERARADPHELARGAQRVHPRRRVGADAARQHVALPHLGGQREPLQADQRLAQPVGPGARGRVAVDALPVRQEARERALVGRLDLLAQRGERGAPQPPQHLGVAPLALRAARAQLAAHEVAGGLERLQHRREVDAVALAQRVGLERAVRAREAPHEPLHRVGHVLGERLGQPGRRHRAERVAEQPGVLGRGPAPLAADPDRDRAPLVGELLEPAASVRRPARRASAASSVVSSPTRRSTSCSASTDSARVRSEMRCRSASTCSSAPSSISSRSSSCPSSSRSSSRSSASAAARRSALGWSPSYM